MVSAIVVRFHTKKTPNLKKEVFGFGVDLVSVGGFFRLSGVHLRWSFSVFFRPPLFFSRSWTLFRRPTRKKGCQKRAQSDDKGGPSALSGTC